MNGLVRDPWRLALFLGPILLIGTACFEEIARVFFLSRWWKIAPGAAWRWLGVLISAVLFGLAHLYQGPGGMANTAISGLILTIVYLRFGRVWPLIISLPARRPPDCPGRVPDSERRDSVLEGDARCIAHGVSSVSSTGCSVVASLSARAAQ
jgi:hypothetical protein